MDNQEIINILKQYGWELFASNKDHNQYKHPIRKDLITIPLTNKDLSTKDLRRIFKKIGVDED